MTVYIFSYLKSARKSSILRICIYTAMFKTKKYVICNGICPE